MVGPEGRSSPICVYLLIVKPAVIFGQEARGGPRVTLYGLDVVAACSSLVGGKAVIALLFATHSR